MKAQDIMTTRVVTVMEDASISVFASLMNKHQISAVPVVDERQHVIGMVSEGDLIRRQEIGTDTHRGAWWLSIFEDRSDLARDYVKSHGKLARDVMSKEVICVLEDTPLSEIAEILEKNHINRVPVVRDNILVGLVSRANIIQQLASGREIKIHVPADDTAVRNEVEKSLNAQPWANVGSTAVTVHKGKVELWGIVESEAEREASLIALESLPGVVSVEDHRAARSEVPPPAY